MRNTRHLRISIYKSKTDNRSPNIKQARMKK